MKKILRIVLFSISGLLVFLLAILHIAYHSFSPGDKGTAVIESNLGYYHDTYTQCRQVFLDEAATLVSQYEGAELFSVKVPCKIDDDLTIDLLYLPPVKACDKLLVISSGVHGIEGFTGSAVQSMFMKEMISPEVLAEMGILMIHAINPYGFKYFRRVTENNVDLNRGSEIDPGLFEKDNPGYAALIDMINPKGEVSASSIRNQFFYLTAISKILKNGMSTTRQAIVQGQYEFPEGLFFGGQDFEPQIDSLKLILPPFFESYTTILEIDLHTAYGSRRVLHLFPNAIDDPELREQTQAIFEGQHIDWGDSDDFYTVSGGFADTFLDKLNPGKQYLYMVFEWGTYDTEKTFGSIKSLQIMINENQGVHYGYKNERQEKKILEAEKELNYPASQAWRSEVMESGRNMLGLVLRTYPELN